MELLGKTIGNYRIERLLGEGSTGAVYQAYDLSQQRNVAVKLLNPDFTRQPNFRERFPMEARALIELNHPGFVKVFDFGQYSDQLYIVMEFLPGGNLHQQLDELIQVRKWFPLNEAVSLVEQLCQTVEYAHDHGISHRDIKPDNLMFKPQSSEEATFQVVLTDLGLTKLLDGQETQPGITRVPAYMSPEQALGNAIDARSSVYSLGILLYELVVGLLPFPVKTPAEAVLYHTREVPAAPRSVLPDLPEALERVILKALEKEPDRRYPNAAEMGKALAEVRSQLPGTAGLTGKREPAVQKTEYQQRLDRSPSVELTSPRVETSYGQTEVEPLLAVPDSAGVEISIQVSSNKEGKPQVLTFQSDSVMIGRDKENQIVLDSPKASRQHARVSWDGSNFYVTDLGSRNGTYLGKTRLQPDVPSIWNPHQELRIGDIYLRLLSQAQPRTILEAPPKTIIEEEPAAPVAEDYGTGFVSVSVTPQQLSVEPGGSVTATLFLRNQSAGPDRFALTLTGIPDDWIGSLPNHVDLMPGKRKETAFTLHIPRAPQSRAGRHQMTLKVTSQRDPSQSVEIKLTLTIAPYSQFRAEFESPRLQASQLGQVTISNVGNLQETFTVQFIDPANKLTFQPPHLQMRLPEGRSASAEFLAKESQLRLLGGEKSYRFSAEVSSPTSESQTLHAELLSRGLFPIWVLPTVLLFCLFITGAAGALWYWYFRAETLTVKTNGSGTVTSSPAGIDCGSTCSFDFAKNTDVTLTANAVLPSTFGGWTGACTGTGTCMVTMSSEQTVTATFNLPGQQTLLLNKTGTGNGTVTSSPPGINCDFSAPCSFAFAENELVTLTANPTSPSIFGGWNGEGCSGTGTCIVTMSAIRSVTATFNLPGKQTLTVSKSGTGSGTVTSSPAGINCDFSAPCSFDFDDNADVTLNASAISPSTFAGWSGGNCSGTGSCTVKMSAAQTVTATFNAPVSQTLTVTVTNSSTSTGTVTSFPAGINNCSTTCSSNFPFDQDVTLTANQTSSSAFVGWGGDCSSFGTSLTCNVKMSSTRSVTAMFKAADNQAPDTTITNPQPSNNPTNSKIITFDFIGTDGLTPSGSLTFECKLDNGNFEACTSPKPYSNLVEGSHTFRVQAKDAAGNVDPVPASFTWTIDTTPPTVTAIERGGPAPSPSSPSMSFTVKFTEVVTGVDAGDFTVVALPSSTITAQITNVTPSSSVATYTVTVRVGNESKSGTISLDLNAGGTSIVDTAGNAIASGFTSGETYSYPNP